MKTAMVYTKLRLANLEDFIWLNNVGARKLKTGYPYWVRQSDGYRYGFVKNLLEKSEREAQYNELRNLIAKDLIYVFDPVFAGDKINMA